MSDEFKVWFNGRLRPFEECTVSVRTHALHYGTSVFEGIRVYRTPDGPRVFHLVTETGQPIPGISVVG